jgi:type IV pilus assembly protein PilV
MTMPSQRTHFAQQGATLIEILITILVVAIGLLGAAGIQLASTRFQQTSALRTEALHQANFIIEKMRVNNAVFGLANLPNIVANPDIGYLSANDYANAAVAPADPGCGLAGQAACTAAQAAQRDLLEWKTSIGQMLPGGRGSIFPVTSPAGLTEANARRVVVMWREKRDNETNNVAGQDAAEDTDALCPAPAVAGIRCLNLWVTP